VSSQLILYSNPMSRGRIARWMLEELGEPYAVHMLEFGAAMKDPAFLKINPMGKVPALCDGDAVVTEVAAICAYLAAAYPDAGLQPAVGTAAHADYLRWLFFAAGPLEAAVTAKSLDLLPPPEKSRMVGYGSFEAVMDTLEHAIEGKDFIAGDRFSAADVYVGAQIGFGLSFKSIEPRFAFEAYWRKLQDRPAHKRATALDDAAIPKP
jgi:glutathione S-transferase